MRDVYVVAAARSPFGRGKADGSLHNLMPVQLLAQVLEEIAERAKIDKGIVEDIVCGCVTPINEQGGNIGRLAPLQAGYPVSVSGVQIDRMCGSGQQAIHFVSQAIAAGDIDIGIGCGVEMMSVCKMGASFPPKNALDPRFTKNFPFSLIPQGLSAEKIAKEYKISRDDVDKFAYESHVKAGKARENGYFKDQIKSIKVPQKDGTIKNIDTDEGIRYPPNMQSIKKLKPVFTSSGVVTAGNSSQISDGAAAVLLASVDAIKKYNLTPIARINTRVCVGSDPIMMLDGVIPATQLALKKAGLTHNDIDVYEINEAFAVVPIAWQKTIGIDESKINPNGGACAHGHPLGCTGSALMTKLVYELQRTNKKYGLQTMCIGWGMATATIVENCYGKILPPYKGNVLSCRL